VPRSRKDAWLRDELILALDLYRREGRNPSSESVRELSEQLRSIPLEPHLAEDPVFRNEVGVRMKVSNFVSINPAEETRGMSRGGRGDGVVFDEFWDDPARLEATAQAIRANMTAIAPDPDPVGDEDDDTAEAIEGEILTRRHKTRERNRRLRERKKAEALAATGRLECEGCGFDFAARYGERGDGYIECHHTVPLSDLRPGTRTRLNDLALVCANCHRMIHRKAEWLSMDELRATVVS
jgi:5-methylcytosine-specific restriction enzyme A